MNQSIEERQGLLKKALAGNAVFSVVSGVAILFANRWLVKFLGLPEKVSLGILGVSLIIYAAILWLNARRPNKNHGRLDCGHHGCRLGDW
jgi:uncharacterized membrane protein